MERLLSLGALVVWSFMAPETLPSAPYVCLSECLLGVGGGECLPSSPRLRGGQSALVSPSSAARYLELLLRQERKNHYLQMTSLCKNASGWLLCRIPGKGREERARSAPMPDRAGASTCVHLGTAQEKSLNFLCYSREALDLGIASFPRGESPRPCDSSRPSLGQPLGCRCTKGGPPGTGSAGLGAGGKVAPLPN